MNNKGEIKILSLMMAMLSMFLFVTVIATSITMFNSNYDTQGYNSTELDAYAQEDSLSSNIKESQEIIETVTIDSGLFDWFAGIFKAVLQPFKFIYQSYTTMTSMASSVSSDLNLMSAVKDYLVTAIILIVVIGIVMIKFYLGKQK